MGYGDGWTDAHMDAHTDARMYRWTKLVVELLSRPKIVHIIEQAEKLKSREMKEI